MPNLNCKILQLVFIILLVSCKSKDVFEIKSFDTKNYRNELHTLTVSSNHVKQECLFLNAEAENKWRRQYMMYILNNDNEVLPVMYSIHQEKSVCLEHLKKVERILKKSSTVNMCLRAPIKKDSESHEVRDFGPLGKHPVIFQSLIFDSVCASEECYSSNDVWEETCPGFEKH